MEWKSVKTHGLPKHDACCLVENEKGWMFQVKAIYHHCENVFTYNNPDAREHLTLEVTHYLIIPDRPKE